MQEILRYNAKMWQYPLGSMNYGKTWKDSHWWKTILVCQVQVFIQLLYLFIFSYVNSKALFIYKQQKVFQVGILSGFSHLKFPQK